MMKAVVFLTLLTISLQSAQSVGQTVKTIDTDVIAELADTLRMITTDFAHVTKVLKVLMGANNATAGKPDIELFVYDNTTRGVGNECLQNVILLLQAVTRHEEWAIRVLDTFGKPPSGMYNKGLHWLGDWDQCRRPHARSRDENVTLPGNQPSYEFTGKYCSASFAFGMSRGFKEATTVTVGTCFPSSCGSSDAETLLQIMIAALPGNSVIPHRPAVTCQENTLPLDGQAIGVITVCAVILATMVATTVYDAIYLHWLRDKDTGLQSARDDVELPDELKHGLQSLPPSPKRAERKGRRRPFREGGSGHKQWNTDDQKNNVYIVQSSPPHGEKSNAINASFRKNSSLANEIPRKDSDLKIAQTRQESASNGPRDRQNSIATAAQDRSNSSNSGSPGREISVAKRAVWRQDSAASKATFRQDSVASVATVDVMIRSQLPEIVERKGDITTSTIERVLLSFSVLKNGTKLLSTRQSKGSLTVLHAIRFITMTWIVVWHVFASLDGPQTYNHSEYAADIVTRIEFTPIFNAMLAVDTFFILSGLLVSYLSLKQLEKQKGIRHFNIAMFYFHRLLRLTPPYMFLLLMWVSLDKYLGDGPLWPQEEGFQREACSKAWWTNLLYINNFVTGGQDNQLGCFGWTWFLACDMQFFIISPLVFIPLFYWPVIGCLVCLVLVAVNAISAGLVSMHYTLPTMAQFDETKRVYMWEFYVKPWCRVGVYAVGMFTGYMLYRTQMRVKINRCVNVLLWLVALTLGGLAVYGLYSPDMVDPLTARESALYNATARTVWAVCVCWVIFSCSCGYGGPINHVLTWPGFVPLARVNYFVYLAHNILISIYNSTQRSASTVYDYSVVYLVLGHLSMSYAAAFVLSLAFEAPVAELEKALLGRRKHKVHVPGA